MKEKLDLLSSALSIIAPVAGAIWVLIKAYYKMEKDLLLQKQSLTDEAIKKLSGLVDKVRDDFNEHRITVKDLEASLKVLTSELANIKESLKQASNQISEYSDKAEKRINNIESQIIKLSRDTFMVKKAK